MRYAQNSQSEFVLGIAFLVLGMIYTAIFCFGVIRYCKMGKKTKYLGKIFYLSIVFSCLAYMLNMALYLYDIFKENTADYILSIEKQLLNTIYIPDGLFWIVYQSLFWTVVCLHYDSHLHIGQQDELPYNPNMLIHVMKDIFLIYGIAQLIVVLLYNFDYIEAQVLFYINIVINLSIPVQFIITSLYLQYKYSGSPFKSSKQENISNRLQKLIFYWTILRVIQIISNFLLMENQEMIKKFFSSDLSQNQLLLYISLLIIDLLLANIFPFILALRQQTFSIFLGNKNVTMSTISEHPMRQQFLNNDSSVMERKQIQFDYNELLKQVVNPQIKRQKPNGFGYILVCQIQQKNYGMRIIEFKQLQTYLIEQLKQEIEQVNQLNHQYLYHIHGYNIVDNKVVYLIKFYQYSLHNYLLQYQTSIEEKIEILIQLLRGISYLHKQGLCHGSLTTENVMIKSNGRVKIIDFGLFGIKKYQSLLQSYTNKTGFTAPELIMQRGQIVSGSQEGDIYSVGMIMYEMFEKKVPFEGLQLQNIQECLNKAVRPKIESKSLMDDIIRWCWQQDFEKRPKVDYGTIVVGSNIYETEFLDEIYIYYGNKTTNTISFKDGLIISTSKLELPEYKFNRSEQGEIIMTIIKEAMNLLEYQKLSDIGIINMFELQYVNQLKSYPSLKFQLMDREQPSILMDVRKSYFTIQNCYQIIKTLNNIDPSTYFKNKYVLLRYPEKKMIVQIKSVVFDQEFTYKGLYLEDYFKQKYQLRSKSNVYLETYNTQNIKKQFLIAEFCELKMEYIEQDVTIYCQQLDYWNRIINNSSSFIKFLNQYKLIIRNQQVEFKQQYLEPGNLVLNNSTKSIFQIVASRTSSEFEYYYSDFFLKNLTTFTTSLTINKLLILVTREIIENKDNFKSFLDKLDSFIKSRQYKISQPQIYDINNNLNEIIDTYVTEDAYVLFVGDSNTDFSQARNNLLSKAIPNQIIILPIQDQEINRLLAMMTANLGSVPWSIKEINGQINNKKSAVLGIWKSDNSFSACLSINKYFNKYISSFGDLDQILTLLLTTYYATHKILANQIIIFAEDDYTQIMEQIIQGVIQLIQNQELAQQIIIPEIVMVQVKDANAERYFTYFERNFESYYCKNPQVGCIVPINEKQGRFSFHSQRGEQGCLQAQQLYISSTNTKEIAQLYYHLIFLNFDLSSITYLPAPLHYAKKLSKHQLQSQQYKKAIEKGFLLFV
ncbi:unnamed protein product [Paramecium pentaurelia]|uniref:Protein kinase domain-containing protein n=1 Tax=Paramecium pentaurelia TaxID=43138 RepID=A0A8S1TUS4_9CILI|nr:unnamed protein product [Paramecium pentaurelia]